MHKTAALLNAVISYQTEGKGPRAVVFLHGDGQRGAMGQHILHAFPSTYMTIAIDRPGHAESTDIPLRTLADEVSVVAHILAQEKIKEVILVGHSSGAAIAAAYATTHNVRALVLSNPLFCDPRKIFWYLPLSFLERAYLKKAEQYYGKKRISGNEKNEEELQTAIFGATLTSILRANFRALDGFDVRKEFKKVNVPTLIISSTHGLLSLEHHIQKISRNMHNCIVETIQHETHNFFLLKKEEIQKIIHKHVKFLRA